MSDIPGGMIKKAQKQKNTGTAFYFGVVSMRLHSISLSLPAMPGAVGGERGRLSTISSP